VVALRLLNRLKSEEVGEALLDLRADLE